MSAKQASPTTIEVPNFARGRAKVTLQGDSMLVTHQFAEKSKREMLGKQKKRAKAGKEVRDPESEYLASLYHHPEGGYGFPVIAFKAAAVGACRYVDGLYMTVARGAFHVNGPTDEAGTELVKIEGSEPRMREDIIRLPNKSADLRYRAMFDPWHVTLDMVYNPSALSLEQIVNLFNIAGFGVGVGEYRPEKNGQWGRFHVENVQEVTK